MEEKSLLQHVHKIMVYQASGGETHLTGVDKKEYEESTRCVIRHIEGWRSGPYSRVPGQDEAVLKLAKIVTREARIQALRDKISEIEAEVI